jgi:ABC-type phosphate transport system auxiliary subunit
MEPQELSTYLRSMAAYINETDKPSQRAIASGIRRAVQELQAGRVTKFVDRDYATATHGLEALIERLGKAARTLNPQNESKAQLEHSVGELQKIKALLSEKFQELANVEI